MKSPSHWLISNTTRAVRRHLVGPQQRWIFEQPPEDWSPPPVERTSFYLHVPFCRHFCPYCPYTKFPYRESQVEPYTTAAMAEVNWWADAIGPAEITSIYIGGGTPTLCLDSVAKILAQICRRFRLTGDICIETNPADVDSQTVKQMKDMGIALVSLGVQSFQVEKLDLLGRGYKPDIGERALALLVQSGFASINADIMFALPQQTADDVTADLSRAAEIGANQITTYPLFTFPYTSVGKYLQLTAVRMPNLRMRRTQYQAISTWCAEHGFERVSVWGFRHGAVPRYSSVTRDGYIGVGPGAGSDLSDGFILNTFDLKSWMEATCNGRRAVALRMPFTSDMRGWWWLYWRLYDTTVPLDELEDVFGNGAAKARHRLRILEHTGLAAREGNLLELTEQGAFWLHLAQNYFALNYVNKLWTQARIEPWPHSIAI